MERPIFDSRDLSCKAPFGAVSCGRLITFRLYPPGEEAVAAAFLVVHREFAGLQEEFPFSAAGEEAPVALPDYFQDIIRDELNSKKVTFTDDVRAFTSYSFKPQLKTVGPKYGKLLGGIRKALSELDGNAAMD